MANIWFDSTYKNVILRDTPSLYWPLNATNGATDQSGNGRNGTGVNGISIGGYVGSPIKGETTATNFDRTATHYISSTYQPYVAATSRTFEVWVNRDDTANFHIVMAGDPDPAAYVLVFANSVQNDAYSAFNGVNNFSHGAAGLPTVATWTHYAVVMDETADAMSCYKNGALVLAPTARPEAYPASITFRLGVAGTANAPFAGKMSHCAVYEYVLHADRIKAHYTAGVG